MDSDIKKEASDSESPKLTINLPSDGGDKAGTSATSLPDLPTMPAPNSPPPLLTPISTGPAKKKVGDVRTDWED